MGATKDGKIIAAEVWMAYEAGGFPGLAGRALARCASLAPYDIPNFADRRLRRGRQPAQDRGLPRAGRDQRRVCLRDAGRRAGATSAESIRCDFRIMNGAHEGTPQPAGPPYKRIGFIETLEAIKNSPHYKSQA